MSKCFWTSACVLLLCFNAALKGLSAETRVAGTNAFIVWNTERDDLLPQSSVIAMTQTRDGYLWLGTMKGLVRFDGMRTEVFNEADVIVCLFEDSQGGLWVGTEKSGVSLIKDGRVSNVDFAPGPGGHLASACEDVSGAVWLYSKDGRLARFRNGQPDKTWPVDFGRSDFRGVIAEKSGELWIGSDGGLSRVASDVRELPFNLLLRTNSLPGKQDFVFASRTGGYWQLVNGRIQKWSAGKMERDLGAYPWKQLQSPVTSACEDAQGNLFVGTLGEGVFRFNASGNVTQIASPQWLNHGSVLSLCLDREGSLWVGTDGGGANRVSVSKFEMQPESAGNNVQLVAEDTTNGLWFAYNGGTLNLWQNGMLKKFEGETVLAGVNLRSLLIDRRGTVWLGGVFGGVLNGGVFQFVNGSFRFAPGLESVRVQVSALFEDSATNIWVGSSEGLIRWDGQAWKLFTKQDGLSANPIRAIAEDKQGDLWIGTDGGGLNRLRDGKFMNILQSPKGLPADFITALLADADGNLWVGTSGGGLGRLRDGKWARFTKRDGLAGNSIAYLLEDGDGFLWIGSNEGLMRAKKSELSDFAEGRADSFAIRTFGKKDGLPTKECSSGSQPAACRTRDGTLWFPTTRGLVGVNPSNLSQNTNPPPVIIESVLVDGSPQSTNALQVAWREDVTVPASKEVVEIHFTSLNLASPERARFKYRLEGHETKWTEAKEMRTARFTKLPHGHYRFVVKASNEDGVWNPQPASVGIVVLPPFWKTWWFQAAAVVVLIGGIVGIVYFISTQKLQRQLALMRQQEALEKERSRIARDLHDQLGANLTQVALLGEMVEVDKNLPEEIESHAQQISKTARDTSTALDEIVWAANPSNDTLEGLVTYACKYAQDYLALAGIRYRLDVPSQLPDANIAPDLRHNVFLAFKESVNNVVKHAKAGEVKIRLRLDAGKFTIEIEDDGRGPGDAAKKTGRNGLRNMRKRMEDVGGTFTMDPGAERGTIVRLTSPITKR